MKLGLAIRNALDNETAIVVSGHRQPHITKVPLQTISKLAPFSALILSIIFVVYFAVRFYLLEGYLLKKCYGDIYTRMNETVRRGFVNHHIAGGTKLMILVIAAYPFVDVAFGSAHLHSPFAGSKIVTMGDILIIAAQALIAMYVFELFYRSKISPVSAGHHIGTIMIGQSAIAISLNLVREKDATIEFILCTVWGAFDIISESLPHLSIILYRVYPTHHKFLAKLFCISAITTFIGTIAETILTMYLFGSLWDRWTLAFKVVTPILHVLFASCQLWGTWNFYRMMKRQQRFLLEEREGEGEKSADEESGSGGAESDGSGKSC
ncbi:hypothetical protein GLAREA_01371 [Glarea lozoyensis ATCC 20868]|uniref:Uncharacterized protein n=1 Tax=Glarea lozoyensis (strain ATCC 20868 / MF5171) TaxID=1116229 RepID=S3CJP9_GLAL2|nr:uncharacterized protein GLAREA_01371 [Glarea lozoyensis ATCC 20868]EPE25459.1 hypothetical protein GLAREA_01371 [Glarea lozoyensis ATCC 20868]